MTGNRLSIKEAAALMNVSEQFIRVGMQRNLLPFGFAIKHKSKWCYYISPAKFTEATGIEINVDTEVAKMGDKADPKELAAAVLHYCEAAGYTISEVDALELAISMARVNNTRKSQRETRFAVNAE